jgi:hypothetical protein
MGLHVRNAVVLVRATVAEAFRDAKRGGGLNPAFADLPADGLEGNTFVLSPNARRVVVRALERNPSGAEKSVCISYILEGGTRGRVKTALASTGGLVKSRVCTSVETESVVDGSECGRGGGKRGDWPGMTNPKLIYAGQTYTNITSALGPRAQHTRPMSSVTEFASRLRFCASCIHVPACVSTCLALAWTPHLPHLATALRMCANARKIRSWTLPCRGCGS